MQIRNISDRKNAAMNVGDSVEAEGANTKEAINSALKSLGVPRDKVKVQVLSEEKKGLFGMKGASQAKVRITIIK
jgi:spoIIIJ-associated protein